MEQALQIADRPTTDPASIAAFEEIRDESRFWDVFLACLLLLPAMLIIAAFYTLYLLSVKDGGSFIYTGMRLGKHKQPFQIMKIRTMVPHAERYIGAELFDDDQSLLLWYGSFLRQTRLDELPQLINILRGEMGFIGPRPIRQVVYQKNSREIQNFDTRFLIRPGLTGYSQFLTPYGTCKKIRSRIDNHFIKGRTSSFSDIWLILWTVSRCIMSTASEAASFVYQRSRMLRNGIARSNQRIQRRKKPHNILGFVLASQHTMTACTLIDINSDAILLSSPERLIVSTEASMLLYIAIMRKRRRKIKRIKGVATIRLERHNVSRSGNAQFLYVITYSPQSSYHRYLVDKYILKKAIAGV
jgi:lipopolysaccharide/colanic/teichoic acid biosynthesis glycosyltransferase